MVNSKQAFWQALVFTILIFVLGIFLGFFLENSRSDTLQLRLLNSEVNLLDEQLRNRVTDDLNVECELAVESTFNFADKIYSEAVNLEKYDSASTLGDDLKSIHRRYDLLRTLLWLESIDLRDRCGEDFHTVVYFYDYATENIEVSAKQNFYSRMLEEIKANHQKEMLLIPIAGNMNLDSVDLALNNYNIEKLPVILINEEIVIDEVLMFEELEELIFNS